MTETPTTKYDLEAVLAAANTQNLIFIGRENAELLAKQADAVVITKQEGTLTTVDVVMFPYLLDPAGEAVVAGAPRRGFYSGTLLSVLLNDRMTKGRFVFADGTVLYRDSGILE